MTYCIQYKKCLHFLLAIAVISQMTCVSSFLTVQFEAYQSPLLGSAGNETIANLGFSGNDQPLNTLTSFLFSQALAADSTLLTIERKFVLKTLSQHSHQSSHVPDSLALVVGNQLNAGIMLVGSLQRTYTEEYGEEKIFRLEEVLGRTGIRLIQRPYVLPYIDQSAVVTIKLKAYQIESKILLGNFTVTESDSYRTVLPEPVNNPPRGEILVETVSPILTEILARRIVNRLMASLVQERIQVTRWLFVRKVGEGISAVREGNWLRATALWEKLLKITPNDGAIWNNLAVAYERVGRLHDAEKAYQRALNEKPDDNVVIFNNREYQSSLR